MKVTIKEIKQIRKMIRRINSVPLSAIEFDIPISPEEIEEWKFTGLNNFHILEMIIKENK